MRRPHVVLLLAHDAAAEVDPPCILLGRKGNRFERYGDLRHPAVVGDLRFGMPDRAPLLDEARIVFAQCVATHAVGVDLEQVVIALAVETVQRHPEAIVGEEQLALDHLRSPYTLGLAVTQVGGDVQVLVVIGYAHDRLFGRPGAVQRRSLVKIPDERRVAPRRIIQPAVDDRRILHATDLERLAMTVDFKNGHRLGGERQHDNDAQQANDRFHGASPGDTMPY